MRKIATIGTLAILMMLLIRAKTLQKLSDGLSILNPIWLASWMYFRICSLLHYTQTCRPSLSKLNKSIQGAHPENGMLLHHIFFTLKDGVTPLMVAVQHGFSRAVTVLMKAKPNVNVQDEVKIA